MANIGPFLDLADLQLFAMAGIFTRLGAALFLLPGIGERAVPVRVRLVVALALAVVLAPLVATLVRGVPETAAGLIRMLIGEAASGLVIGLALRFAILALQTAGAIAAQHISVAQMFGAGVAPEPEPTIATLLAMGGIVLAFAAGLHVRVVVAVIELYELLPFGALPQPGELAAWSVGRVAGVFALGLSLALPFVAASFAYNLALGALSRAMPQLLVALVGAPLLIGLGLVVLAAALPEIFARWSSVLDALLADPLGDPLGGSLAAPPAPPAGPP